MSDTSIMKLLKVKLTTLTGEYKLNFNDIVNYKKYVYGAQCLSRVQRILLMLSNEYNIGIGYNNNHDEKIYTDLELLAAQCIYDIDTVIKYQNQQFATMQNRIRVGGL